MGFFEFFFSGPGWGWKVFALILLIDTILNGIATIIKTIFEAKSIDILTKRTIDTTEEDKSNNTEATIDDFR